jgi:hypothetical protein
MDIFVPQSLNGADAVLAMVSQMENLLDTNKRKAMTEDIIKFHALNDAEAKKAADARAMIKQHTDVLEQTRKLAADTAEEKKNLALAKQQFEVEMQAEKAKLALEKSDVKIALDKATQLNSQAVEMKNNVTMRENELSKNKAEHVENLKKHEDEKKALTKQKADIDEYKRQVIALDNETKAKVEKLKQFNF